MPEYIVELTSEGGSEPLQKTVSGRDPDEVLRKIITAVRPQGLLRNYDSESDPSGSYKGWSFLTLSIDCDTEGVLEHEQERPVQGYTEEVEASGMVPDEIAVAVITRRPQLLQVLRNRLQSGKQLDPADALTLIDLIEQSIEHWAEIDAERAEMARRLRNMKDNAGGVASSLGKLIDDFDLKTRG